MVYIDKIESRQSVRMASTVGTRVPFHSTGVGKAYLAALPEHEAEVLMQSLELQEVTPLTAANLKDLRARVAQGRRDGYVFDDQENELGIVCYGGAILEAPGQPAASVSVSVPLFRHALDGAIYRDPLLACINEISRLQGFEAGVGAVG